MMKKTKQVEATETIKKEEMNKGQKANMLE